MRDNASGVFFSVIVSELIQHNYERILPTVPWKKHYKVKRHSAEILPYNGTWCLLCHLQKIKTFSLFDCVRSVSSTVRTYIHTYPFCQCMCVRVQEHVFVCARVCVINYVGAFVFYKFNSHSFSRPKCSTIVLLLPWYSQSHRKNVPVSLFPYCYFTKVFLRGNFSAFGIVAVVRSVKKDNFIFQAFFFFFLKETFIRGISSVWSNFILY